ncbi:hypothetical protein ACER0C_026991 [Sarotherodon galilaeus]
MGRQGLVARRSHSELGQQQRLCLNFVSLRESPLTVIEESACGSCRSTTASEGVCAWPRLFFYVCVCVCEVDLLSSRAIARVGQRRVRLWTVDCGVYFRKSEVLTGTQQIQFKGARRRGSSRSCRANAAAQAWAGAADEWQRITDEDTVTHLTLLHSRGGGVVVVMGKGGKRGEQ